MNRLDLQQSDVHGDAAFDQAGPVSISSELKEESTFCSREPLVIFPAAADAQSPPGLTRDGFSLRAAAGCSGAADQRSLSVVWCSSVGHKHSFRSGEKRRDASVKYRGARTSKLVAGARSARYRCKKARIKASLLLLLGLLSVVLLLVCLWSGRRVTDQGSGVRVGFRCSGASGPRGDDANTQARA